MFPHQLSPIDHLSPRIHVPKLLYFQTTSSQQEIYSTLLEGLSRTLTAFPILSGSVRLLHGASQTGTLAIQEPFFISGDILSSKDLTTKYDFASLEALEFPPDGVDHDLISPDVESDPSRVFLAQVNFVRGGFILVIALHHCVFDETGIFAMLKLWSSFCCDTEAPSIVTPEWINRTALMTGEGKGRLEDHPEYKLLPPQKPATNRVDGREYISSSTDSGTDSVILFISDSALKELKEATSMPDTSSDEWISTQDALSALLWSRITYARSVALPKQEISLDQKDPQPNISMFNTILNARSLLTPSISESYTGNVLFVTKAFLSTSVLSDPSNFPRIAKTIRNSIKELSSPLLKDKMAAVRSVDDIGRLAPGGYNSSDRHVGCSSWSRQEYYKLDWGDILGNEIRRVRWRKSITDGIFVIFPHLPSTNVKQGGLEVFLGLRKECMRVLREDNVLGQYTAVKCVV
ncbi:transferase family-domain-containing protein [Halenospora varia]|nr:transferase family-domain-containing protein [Halenospora varia]